MSNERPDEFLSWRGRLSSPDALPGKGLDDREQTWERLAERLSGKSRRRSTPWWIAAACLVMASLPATHLFRGRATTAGHIARHTVQPQPLPAAARATVRPSSRQQAVTSAPNNSLTSASRPEKSDRVATRPTAEHGLRVAAGRPAAGRTARPPATDLLAMSPATDPASTPPGANAPSATLPATDPAAILQTATLPADDPFASNARGAATSPAAQPIVPGRRPLRIVCLNEISQDAAGPANFGRKGPPLLQFGHPETTEWATNVNNTPLLTIGLHNSPNH